MSGSFTAVDLSRLPAPSVVENLDYEAILSEMIADLKQKDDEFNAIVESDPAYKILEVCAYREMMIRQRVNNGAKAVMLAYSSDTDLDNLAANYNVKRSVIDPGDPDSEPPVPPIYESDADLRRRVQLAFEGLSTAGPEGSYIFHALGSHPDVLDASVSSPEPGQVVVTVLSRIGDGSASAELVDEVASTLSSDDVRPLSDTVTTKGAEIIDYSVSADLALYEGPDSSVVLQAARESLSAYVDKNHRLGRGVTLSGIYSALHREGVQNVILYSPASDVLADGHQAAYCSAINVTTGGIDG